jgi:hypothetical protein
LVLEKNLETIYECPLSYLFPPVALNQYLKRFII